MPFLFLEINSVYFEPNASLVDCATEKFTPMLFIEVKRVLFLEEIEEYVESAISNVSSQKKKRKKKKKKKREILLVRSYHITLKASA